MSHPFVSLFTTDLPPTDTFSQPQREAFVDLLYFCTYADRKLQPAETALIKDVVEILNWESPVALNAFFEESGERARAAVEEFDSRTDFLANVSHRLATTEMKTYAVGLCPKLFRADGEYVSEERAVFAEIRKAFGWPT